jgi:hypothetical protein
MALHHHDPALRDKMRSEARAWHAFRATATPEERAASLRMFDEGKSRKDVLEYFGQPTSRSAGDDARERAQAKSAQASALWDEHTEKYNERFR